MRITFNVDGGFAVFPGLSRPVSFEVDDLPLAEASAVRLAVGRSDFALDDPSTLAAGGADVRKYVVTIEEGVERRSLVIPETVQQPDLKALLRLLDEQRRTQRSG